MTTGEMFKGSLMLKVLLIFINFTVFSFGKPVLFIVLGILTLAMGCFMALRQGAAIGHEACSVSSTLERIAQAPEKAGQRDGGEQDDEYDQRPDGNAASVEQKRLEFRIVSAGADDFKQCAGLVQMRRIGIGQNGKQLEVPLPGVLFCLGCF